ncbi:unnamed protein product [Vitrella brassicaformis CCMP3155]|uniref:MATH domain-containing protein n=3 Tax=Vitrella brassicaformis TaxID=1169539 RepID=A0A0G4ET89_VITBC|nr:unnamed protein product [Vitrella brassicaformis CCMP3155]|eukprot:CEM01388.1 unnamed protein product [Vitrella brassicaformis CCMP3155]
MKSRRSVAPDPDPRSPPTEPNPKLTAALDQIEELQSRNNVLEKSVEDLTAHVEALEKQNQASAAMAETLMQQLQSLSGKVTDQNDRISNESKAVNDRVSSLETHTDERLKEVTERIDELETDLISRIDDLDRSKVGGLQRALTSTANNLETALKSATSAIRDDLDSKGDELSNIQTQIRGELETHKKESIHEIRSQTAKLRETERVLHSQMEQSSASIRDDMAQHLHRLAAAHYATATRFTAILEDNILRIDTCESMSVRKVLWRLPTNLTETTELPLVLFSPSFAAAGIPYLQLQMAITPRPAKSEEPPAMQPSIEDAPRTDANADAGTSTAAVAADPNQRADVSQPVVVLAVPPAPLQAGVAKSTSLRTSKAQSQGSSTKGRPSKGSIAGAAGEISIYLWAPAGIHVHFRIGLGSQAPDNPDLAASAMGSIASSPPVTHTFASRFHLHPDANMQRAAATAALHSRSITCLPPPQQEERAFVPCADEGEGGHGWPFDSATWTELHGPQLRHRGRAGGDSLWDFPPMQRFQKAAAEKLLVTSENGKGKEELRGVFGHLLRGMYVTVEILDVSSTSSLDGPAAPLPLSDPSTADSEREREEAVCCGGLEVECVTDQQISHNLQKELRRWEDKHVKKAEWRINNLSERLSVCRGEPLVSPSFHIAGIPDVSLQFWPEGYTTAAKQFCSLFLSCPPGVAVNASLWAGGMMRRIQHFYERREAYGKTNFAPLNSVVDHLSDSVLISVDINEVEFRLHQQSSDGTLRLKAKSMASDLLDAVKCVGANGCAADGGLTEEKRKRLSGGSV